MDALLSLGLKSHATVPLDVLAGLTLLSVVPFLLIMCTSFVRIVVVLSLIRSAIGASALPPNAILTGLAFALTLVVMTPTLQRIDREALSPYRHHALSPAQVVDRAVVPLRAFMLRQAHAADVKLFDRIARRTPDLLSCALVKTPWLPANGRLDNRDISTKANQR